jgi:hypothetical protein
MAAPQLIKIFLPDGQPNGVRYAMLAGSNVRAIAFSQTQADDAIRTQSELGHSGVYILFGRGEDASADTGAKDPRPRYYIGEAEDVAQRLRSHIAAQRKAVKAAAADLTMPLTPWWEQTIVIVSADQEITKAHARYIEARLIADAKGNADWRALNGTDPSDSGKLPKMEQAITDHLIGFAKLLVGALGCDLFSGIGVTRRREHVPAQGKPDSASIAAAEGSSPEFMLKGESYDGRMRIVPDGVLLLAGSILRKDVTPSASNFTKAQREDLLKLGLVEDMGDGFRLKEDRRFRTPSGAAGVVAGVSISGPDAWKLPDGRNYADYQEAEAAAPPEPPLDSDSHAA